MTVVDVDRLVDDLADVVHGVVRAVACTADGTPLATSAGLPPAQASRLAALAAGIAGLAAGTAAVLGATRVHCTTIEMAQGALVLTTLPDGTHLAVLTIRE
ncbi:roadblock/LC7 domain-containing protein [Actinophytocola algeriensis]|jgi:predicted regulator of Ras-like GTPase activity (Roadblock/LC7/MglB family)|uniref:Putative regulator of Ras-like GTPase activity (Roadblock/LC7/MglB family) n=1 Tax=Actinophytocola algeriensis TaxID=1768010 RepID=A0A7W7Q945_9PSEU|nr:roadblock/LC7 domain-containing protein [Actinophytocola algeriensis]MBB4909128.1 putative regulator of Ras-like GTPase activity (Roadblock/LC7/MglB family) [Actinophytocola algeriensis]MBE1474484.1 putative regulator of Ras-like GTPase activity (Roadblock/LC7/MglB family) [Actinophytocola algeriensis]